jgi:hypothetical protein
VNDDRGKQKRCRAHKGDNDNFQMSRTNPRWQWNNSGLRLLATSQSVLWVKRRRLQYKQACPLYASITDINHFFRAPWHVG